MHHYSENICRSRITDQSLECMHPESVTKDIVDKDTEYENGVRTILDVISLSLGQ